MTTLFLIFPIVLFTNTNALNNFADITCGRLPSTRVGKVVGGQDAKEGEFPWLVSVTRRGGHFCGGSLLTNKHILTAGHCLCSGIGTDTLKAGNIKVTLGQHDLSKNSPSAYEMTVKEVTIHPEYACNKAKHDLAVLELADELQWSDNVSPACLPAASGENEYRSFDNVIATVAGWGWTNENSAKGGRAKILQKASVNVIEQAKCQQWYKSQGKKIKIRDTQICAGYENGGIDSCWADSGGPLMVTSNDKMMVVGVVSTGIGCARPYLPGLYTRVSDYIPWIKSVIEN